MKARRLRDGHQRARRTRTPVDPTSSARGGRSLRTHTSTASRRGSVINNALGQPPGERLEQPVGAPADHVGRHLGQRAVVHRVGQRVALLGRRHVDPGHNVEREGLGAVPLFGEHAVDPQDAQVTDLYPVGHVPWPRAGIPSSSASRARPGSPIACEQTSSTSATAWGGLAMRPDQTRYPATTPITRSPNSS